MTVRVRLFAAARQVAAAEQIDLALAEGATIADLRRALLAECPALAELLPHAAFAVDENYANDATLLTAASDVACIPPVSGG